MSRWKGAAATAAAAALLVPSTAATAQEGGHGRSPVTTLTSGLDGPRQLNDYRGDWILVAESDTGEVSAVDSDTGEVETLLTGLPNPQGVAYRGDQIFVALGEAGPPDETGESAAPEPAADGPAGSSLVVAEPDGEIVRSYDLLGYEMEENPDGQQQFVDGAPVDALSNPFAVLAQKHRILVADAGANAVLAIDRDSGEISTFFVPPVVSPEEVPACGEAHNNPGTVGCDPVPTGITQGRDGRLYVSTLGAEVPGAARVYVLDQDGEEERRIEGLSGTTGIAVDRSGRVYVSELFANAPAEEPGPGFDPSPIGRIVRIDRDGDRATVAVTLPTGLHFEDGKLHASAWSIAGFLGLEGRGEVVRVDLDAFEPED